MEFPENVGESGPSVTDGAGGDLGQCAGTSAGAASLGLPAQQAEAGMTEVGREALRSKAREARVPTPECGEQATARMALEESSGQLGPLGLAPGSCPGLSSGLGHSQSHFVPREPLGCLARLVLLVHLLAVIPTEDIFRGRQGARLAGRTWTAPSSRELGEGTLTSLQCDPWGCLPRAVASLPGKF